MCVLDKILKKSIYSEKIFTVNFFKIILVATLLSFCTMFQATTFPLYMTSLGGSLALAGATTSIYMGMSMLCKPFVGRMLDKMNRKKVLLISVFIFSAMLVVLGYISSIPMLLFTRVLIAPFYSAGSAAAATIATELIPDSRMTEGLGYYSLSQTLSSALGPSIALALVYNLSFKAVFITASLFALFTGITVLTIRYNKKNQTLPEEVSPTEKTPPAAPSGDEEINKMTDNEDTPGNSDKKPWVLEKLTEKGAFLPSVMGLLFNLGAAGMLTFLPTFADTFGIGNIGLFFTLEAIVLAISRAFIGKLSKKLGHTMTITISLIFMTVTLMGIFLSRTLPLLLIFAVLSGLGKGAIDPELHSLAIKRTSVARRGSTNSFYQMAREGGVCISSLYLGIIATLAGIKWIYLVGSFFPVLALIVYFTMLRPQIIREKI